MGTYLDSIDAELWPGVVTVPGGLLQRSKARRAETEFAKACARAGLAFDDGAHSDFDIHVEHDALFLRLATSGWLGLAESYMAGEWSTPSSDRLTHVLSSLIGAGYLPKAKLTPVQDWDGGELPQELIRYFSGDGMSVSSGLYASGVPTTVRESVPNYASKGPGTSHHKTHFVDITTLTEPTGVERSDLEAAQQRAADWLLDAAHVGAGSHVAVFSATGAQLPLRASLRRATTDFLTADEDHAQAVIDDLTLAGAADAVHCHVLAQPLPSAKEWRGRYDAVLSVEKLETMSLRQRKQYAATLDRFVSSDGRVALQSVVETEQMNQAGRAAVDVLRGYVWPGLEYPTMTDIHRLFDRHTGLRIVAETRFGQHYTEALAQQLSFFEGRAREAAADGYDAVFRRLWTYQLCLRQALAKLGMIETIQATAIQRNRRGRR